MAERIAVENVNRLIWRVYPEMDGLLLPAADTFVRKIQRNINRRSRKRLNSDFSKK